MNQTHIAISIVLGSLLISAAVLLKEYPSTTVVAGTPAVLSGDPSRADNQHIYGNEKADITIVEFSDYECPFCARLHPTLKRIVDESGGDIKWEYRHLPLQNHANAFDAAVASECIAQELGDEAFWSFSETLFSSIGTHNGAFYAAEAQNMGIDSESYVSCINNQEIKDIVTEDLRVAQSLGGRGTPFSVIVDSDGGLKPVSGALPYEHWMNALNSIE